MFFESRHDKHLHSSHHHENGPIGSDNYSEPRDIVPDILHSLVWVLNPHTATNLVAVCSSRFDNSTAHCCHVQEHKVRLDN